MKFNDTEVEVFIDRKAERLAKNGHRARAEKSFFGSKEPRRKERRTNLRVRQEMLDY